MGWRGVAWRGVAWRGVGWVVWGWGAGDEEVAGGVGRWGVVGGQRDAVGGMPWEGRVEGRVGFADRRVQVRAVIGLVRMRATGCSQGTEGKNPIEGAFVGSQGCRFEGDARLGGGVPMKSICAT